MPSTWLQESQDSLPAAIRAVMQRKELGELEKLETRLEQRLARRVHDVRYPDWDARVLLRRLVHSELKCRSALLHAEHAQRQVLGVQEYRDDRDTRAAHAAEFASLFAPCQSQARQDAAAVLQVGVARVLRKLSNKLLQGIEARNIEVVQDGLRQRRKEIALREGAPYPRPPHFPELAINAQQWMDEKRARDAATRRFAGELMEATRPKDGDDGDSCVLQEQPPVLLVVIGIHHFELVTEKTKSPPVLLHRFGDESEPVKGRLEYDQENGVLLCNGLHIFIPERIRNETTGKLAAMAEAARIEHELASGDPEAALAVAKDTDADVEEHPQRSEAPAGLFEYAVLYRCPPVTQREADSGFEEPMTPAETRLQRQRGLHCLRIEMRVAILRATPWVDEVSVQRLRGVSRELRAVVEDSGFVAERRSRVQTLLQRYCGIRWAELPCGEHCLGKPSSWDLNEHGVRVDKAITFRGFGDSTIDYTAPSLHQQDPGVYVSEYPITVRQWRRIARTFPHIAHLVTEADLRLHHYNLIPPAGARNARMIKRDVAEVPGRWFGGRWRAPDDAGTVDGSMPLELPFETAAKIAAALGCSIPTWQEWEVGTRGLEERDFAWGHTPAEEADLDIDRLPFGWAVPNPRRGMCADNGYVELASTAVAVHALHRARGFPKGEVGQLSPAFDAATMASGSPNLSPRHSRASFVVSPCSPSGGGGFECWRLYRIMQQRVSITGGTPISDDRAEGSALRPPLSQLLEVKVAPTAESPVLRRIGYDPVDGAANRPELMASERQGWLRLADGSGWVRMLGNDHQWRRAALHQLESGSPEAGPVLPAPASPFSRSTLSPRRFSTDLTPRPRTGGPRRALGSVGAGPRPSDAAQAARPPVRGGRRTSFSPAPDELHPRASHRFSAGRRVSDTINITLPGSVVARLGRRSRIVSWNGPRLSDTSRRSSLCGSEPGCQSPFFGMQPLWTPRSGDAQVPYGPVLRGVMRMGKEWNICKGDCALQRSQKVIWDRALRSASDLFSVQDVCQQAVALPRSFYASNHRAFSGPPLWCVAEEPRVMPIAERRAAIERDVLEGIDETRHPSISSAGSFMGEQVRMKGRGVRMRVNSPAAPGRIESEVIAPTRACFRLALQPGNGLAQLHPCRPLPRRCRHCFKEYFWRDECPHCSGMTEQLRKCGLDNLHDDTAPPSSGSDGSMSLSSRASQSFPTRTNRTEPVAHAVIG
eukprot:TRINITY_DN60524_c0_g1_i1.p1 TRINITY_DN60524_c0_g1~~TRINITY_DN60524_c0_g1_i1.p1  ORF type:complete len:1219 (+),score=244.92 TRINITY_DN60524_c0_g1_i1:97-3753(+)